MPDEKNSDDIYALCGRFVAEIAMIAILAWPAILWQSYVMAKVWNWFIPATFGLRHLSIGAAVGIRATIGAFRPIDVPPGQTASNARLLAFAFLAPAVSLGIAWLFRLAILAGYLSPR